jgi:protein-tyrosine phosphatase
MNDKAPTWDASREAREELWSEVVPGLWQGGTAWDDVVWNTTREPSPITSKEFDLVATLYADAHPVDWFVEEIRLGILDGAIDNVDLDRVLRLVHRVHAAWKSGDRVLVRCQAGWNRSGLVTALVLIRDGMDAHDAIELIRERRSSSALCNRDFVNWLLAHGAEAVRELTPTS